MKAVILAGGMGTRLRPIIGENQKVMHNFTEKPLLERTLDILKNKGFKDIVIVVSYRKEEVMDHFKDGKEFGVNIEYVTQANPKGGTADAVRYAESKIDDKFLLVYGDNVFESDTVDDMLKKNFDGVLCVKEVLNPAKFGVVETDGEFVKKIWEKVEKPPTNLALTGVFILPKDIFQSIKETKISPRGEYELTDSIQTLIDNGMRFTFVKVKGFWMDPRDEEEMDEVRRFIRLL